MGLWCLKSYGADMMGIGFSEDLFHWLIIR